MAQFPGFANTPLQSVRDYWNRRPCNLRHSPQPVGTLAYFREVGQRKYFVEPHIPAFAQFEKWAGKQVLEIGCGLGTDTVSFAKAGAHVTAIDLSDQSLKLAQQRIDLEQLTDRVTFLNTNAETLANQLPAQSFDLIYSFGVIHHTPHPDRVLAQIRQLLRPGGTVKIMVYHRYATKVLGVLLTEGYGQFWKLDALIARHSEAQTGCPVTYSYTRSSARNLIESAGLKVRAIQVDHIFPYRVRDYVQYRYVKRWYYRCMPPMLFRALEQTFGWHLCITAEG